MATALADCMTETVETSHRVGHLALNMLRELGLEANARNYETWVAHVEGHNPALSRDIQKFMHVTNTVSQEEADVLYHSHIARADLAKNVNELASNLQMEIEELFTNLETRGENSHQHSDELSGLSTQLRKTAEEFPAVGSLIENVVAVTKQMREENQQLESNLAASTSEISTLRRNVVAIQKEAMSDPLTGVSNRKSFDRAILKMIEATKDQLEPLALVMADVDHFKNFNDKYGHQTGDQVLRLVAEVMKANVKGQDMLARYGGEEFSILLPGTTLENAHMLADRIRRAVEARRLKKRQSNEDLGVVTMSMGVAAFSSDDTTQSLIERADQSLYLAKQRGRNCVIDEREIEGNKNKTEAHVA